tara:strand:+ start:1906 stop:2331 length:426 start_codon:yes stop_codon:yes gene_type:complete
MNILDLSGDILSIIKKELTLIRRKPYYEKVKIEFHKLWREKRPCYKVHISMRHLHEGRFFLTNNPGSLIKSQFFNHFYIMDVMFIDFIRFHTNPYYRVGMIPEPKWSKKKLFEYFNSMGWKNHEEHCSTRNDAIRYLMNKS